MGFTWEDQLRVPKGNGRFSGRWVDMPWRTASKLLKALSDIDSGRVSTLVVWRLDRPGRTASGLTTLVEKLAARRVNLVNTRDGADLSMPAGRLLANDGVRRSLRKRDPLRASACRAGCRPP